IAALRTRGAAAAGPTKVTPVGISRNDSRNVRRIDDFGTVLLQDGDRLFHQRRLIGVETAPLRACLGRESLIEKRARDPYTGTLQRSWLEKLRVVVFRNAPALRGRRIVRIDGTFEDAKKNRGIRDRSRHRSGRVLIRGDRYHTIPADTTDGRLDGCQHVRV